MDGIIKYDLISYYYGSSNHAYEHEDELISKWFMFELVNRLAEKNKLNM